jgi:hypothetical protein
MSTPDDRYLATLATSLTEAADLAAWSGTESRGYGSLPACWPPRRAGPPRPDVRQRRLDVMPCTSPRILGHFRGRRKALAAQAISDPSNLTCVANDEGFERVFARGVEAWGNKGDALVVFSTSGNSPNILAAVEAARAAGLMTYALLGRDGGAVHGMCNMSIVVPGTTSDRIQEVHIKIVHLLIEQIEARLFGDPRQEETP